MEHRLFKALFEEKQVMNPMNPSEVFTCNDLMEGKLSQSIFNLLLTDYKTCKKERRLQTAKIGKNQSCLEYRTMGKFLINFYFVANKCFYMTEQEFTELLLDKLEKRRKFADFLE